MLGFSTSYRFKSIPLQYSSELIYSCSNQIYPFCGIASPAVPDPNRYLQLSTQIVSMLRCAIPRQVMSSVLRFCTVPFHRISFPTRFPSHAIFTIPTRIKTFGAGYMLSRSFANHLYRQTLRIHVTSFNSDSSPYHFLHVCSIPSLVCAFQSNLF